MLNFIVHDVEKEPEQNKEEVIAEYKSAFEKIKDNTAPNRAVYINEILRVISSQEFTKEELDLNDDDIKYLEGEQIKSKERQNLRKQIDFLRRDIDIESGKMKFFRNMKILKEKALEIKKIIDENGLSYEECGIESSVISKLIK